MSRKRTHKGRTRRPSNRSGRPPRTETIEGVVPRVIGEYRGCRFANRCPLADETCRSVSPEMRTSQDGHRVRLDGIGLLKLEIESDKVDRAEEFDLQKNIRNYRIHLLPESREGYQALYEGIQLEPAVK